MHIAWNIAHTFNTNTLDYWQVICLDIIQDNIAW